MNIIATITASVSEKLRRVLSQEGRKEESVEVVKEEEGDNEDEDGDEEEEEEGVDEEVGRKWQRDGKGAAEVRELDQMNKKRN